MSDCCSPERPHYHEAPPDDGEAHWVRATWPPDFIPDPPPVIDGDLDIRIKRTGREWGAP